MNEILDSIVSCCNVVDYFSQEAQIIIENKNIDLNKYVECDGFIKIDGRKKIARYFKKYGKKIKIKNILYYQIYNAKLNSKNYHLSIQRIEEVRKEKPIVMKYLKAIFYILSQLESNLKIVINK